MEGNYLIETGGTIDGKKRKLCWQKRIRPLDNTSVGIVGHEMSSLYDGDWNCTLRLN